MEKWYHKLQSRAGQRILLAALLGILVANALYWGTKKEGFFGDELYSYHYVNQIEYPYITEDREGEPWMDFWHTSDFFMDYLTISEEEAFDIPGTYRSIAKDVHPPLYYLLLEMSCSAFGVAFPGAFSKWCGILVNIVFFLLTLLLLYKLAEYMTKSRTPSLVTCAFYGLGAGAVSTVVFVRMYMMFTCFGVLFTYLNALFWKRMREGKGKTHHDTGLYAALFVSTILGVLTHYYFLVYAFFLCISIWLYSLITKKFGFALRYAGTMAAGLVGSYLLWPDMKNDIFTGYRGTEAFDNFTGHMDSDAYKAFFSLINTELFGGCGIVLLLFLAAVIFAGILSFYWKVTKQTTEEGGMQLLLERKSRKEKMVFRLQESDFILVQIGLAVFFYMMVIAKIAPYQEDRYLFNVLPMAAVSVVYLTGRIWNAGKNGRIWQRIVLAGLLCFALIGYLTTGVNYLYQGTEARLATAEQYSHLPAFYIHQGSTFRACGDSVYFSKADAVYPTREEEIDTLAEALEAWEAAKGTEISQCLLYLDLRVSDADSIVEQVKQELEAKETTALFHTEYSAAYLVKMRE
ncbi:MAG: hypothetical protein NC318_12405 [Blautia sp.]|nr:hypothetical protein [Lachnoclostridium sp.]MCM1212392.1 hypothetical protein [Blautia sp.]